MSYQQFRPSSFKLLPDAVKNLLIINFLLFLADNVFAGKLGFSLNYKYGLYYIGSDHFMPIQFVTHLFLHGSWMHIFSNMFALWMFGNILENVWGAKRFLVYYFACGLGAAFIQTLATGWEISGLADLVNRYAQHPDVGDFTALVNQLNPRGDILLQLGDFLHEWQLNPQSTYLGQQSVEYAHQILQLRMDVPTVGASGAVFGVLLAFGMLFPNTPIYLYFFLPIKAKYFVIIYGLFELYSGFQNNPSDNVAHFAHLGGMLFGFILIKVWNKKRRNDFY